MDIQEIMALLPHRYPFLLVDRILELEPGKRAVALKNVTANEYFFPGHFPGQPVMPGVLIVEALAQAGACAVLSLEAYRGKILYLGAVTAKFRSKVVPGDALRLEVEFTRLKKNAGLGLGTAYVGDRKAAEAEITFLIG